MLEPDKKSLFEIFGDKVEDPSFNLLTEVMFSNTKSIYIVDAGYYEGAVAYNLTNLICDYGVSYYSDFFLTFICPSMRKVKIEDLDDELGVFCRNPLEYMMKNCFKDQYYQRYQYMMYFFKDINFHTPGHLKKFGERVIKFEDDHGIRILYEHFDNFHAYMYKWWEDYSKEFFLECSTLGLYLSPIELCATEEIVAEKADYNVSSCFEAGQLSEVESKLSVTNSYAYANNVIENSITDLSDVSVVKEDEGVTNRGRSEGVNSIAKVAKDLDVDVDGKIRISASVFVHLVEASNLLFKLYYSDWKNSKSSVGAITWSKCQEGERLWVSSYVISEMYNSEGESTLNLFMSGFYCINHDQCGVVELIRNVIGSSLFYWSQFYEISKRSEWQSDTIKDAHDKAYKICKERFKLVKRREGGVYDEKGVKSFRRFGGYDYERCWGKSGYYDHGIYYYGCLVSGVNDTQKIGDYQYRDEEGKWRFKNERRDVHPYVYYDEKKCYRVSSVDVYHYFGHLSLYRNEVEQVIELMLDTNCRASQLCEGGCLSNSFLIVIDDTANGLEVYKEKGNSIYRIWRRLLRVCWIEDDKYPPDSRIRRYDPQRFSLCLDKKFAYEFINNLGSGVDCRVVHDFLCMRRYAPDLIRLCNPIYFLNSSMTLSHLSGLYKEYLMLGWKSVSEFLKIGSRIVYMATYLQSLKNTNQLNYDLVSVYNRMRIVYGYQYLSSLKIKWREDGMGLLNMDKAYWFRLRYHELMRMPICMFLG